jgi:urease accessory protein UreE
LIERKKTLRIFAARPAIVVDSLPANVTPADLEGKEMDRLLLSWEQRRWMRGRFATENGREIGVALPTGMQIEPGQIMWIGADWYLVMAAAMEPLLTIHVANYEQAIRIAFEVGNLHFPLAISGENLLVPDDSAMTQLLGRLGVSWQQCSLAFQPIGKGSPHDR